MLSLLSLQIRATISVFLRLVILLNLLYYLNHMETDLNKYKNSSGDEIANVNYYAVPSIGPKSLYLATPLELNSPGGEVPLG